MAAHYSNPNPLSTGAGSGDEDSSQLLADALKKMDGLIGDFRPPTPDPPVLSSDPVVLAISDHCEQLGSLIGDWNQRDIPPGAVHPRECVPASVQEAILTWLGGVDLEQSRQLTQDKEELLGQVVSLQQQLEALRGECSKLTSKVGNVEKRCVEKDQRLRDVTEELRVAKVSLSTREVELRHLQDQIQAGVCRKKVPSISREGNPRRRSFRQSLKKAFVRKHRHSPSQPGASNSQQQLINPRATLFCAKNNAELVEWFKDIGLDMYCDLVEEKQLTGEKLYEFVMTEDTSQHLVEVGILSTLHCKKLEFAVQGAVCEDVSPVAKLDHEWVGQWLVDIGLPQFQRMFLDARFDGFMLNMITLEDLRLLDVTVPFHLASIKRALQALRMCGYNKDYLKDSCPEKTSGSQKLLHWSSKDVAQWVCSIELDEYVSGLDIAGIHGALMFLDVNFSSESLARALGISQSKTIIRKHLSKKFLELIGPVAAQKKVDAMQSKSFVPLDPTETPSGFSRHRSRSVNSRKKQTVMEYLLPIDKFPAAVVADKSSPTTSLDVPTRYPTP